ncbi:hypothetical protein [Alteromonas gilva]|uniref:Lipoprotein n=1 Tax=Alteromonas gilva TaxID=2987522 RepID=A0ABT5KXA0_9ALTE|nr:hypothetical protein [Alteromonas gilva]MDC8829385.1 hypothetical protein [Alteromonas gilva]
MRMALLSFILLLASGCVSIPPQAVTSQALIVSGLESAKNNQLKIINAYADDQIVRVENLMKNVVIDDVIASELKGRKALPADEVRVLLVEYAEDLRSEISKIEASRQTLLKETEASYGQLIDLAKANYDFLKTAHDAATIQNDLIDKYKEKLKEVEKKVEDYVNSEE